MPAAYLRKQTARKGIDMKTKQLRKVEARLDKIESSVSELAHAGTLNSRAGLLIIAELKSMKAARRGTGAE